MKPEDYKIGTYIIYKYKYLTSSLSEGLILSYSDSNKYVQLKYKNGNSSWHEIDDIRVVDTVDNLKEKYRRATESKEYFTKEDIEYENKNIWSKEDDMDYQNLVASYEKPKSFLDKLEDYSYPENYSQTNCLHYVEFFKDNTWKMYKRNFLSIPKLGIGSDEMHPYVIGRGEIDNPQTFSMFTIKYLKLIVDGLNSVTNSEINLDPYPKMTSVKTTSP